MWVGGPFPDFYHSTFHAPWYIFEHWSKIFEIKAYVVRGSLDFQDLLLLRRRDERVERAETLPAAEPKNIKRNVISVLQWPRKIYRKAKYRRILLNASASDAARRTDDESPPKGQ